LYFVGGVSLQVYHDGVAGQECGMYKDRSAECAKRIEGRTFLSVAAADPFLIFLVILIPRGEATGAKPNCRL